MKDTEDTFSMIVNILEIQQKFLKDRVVNFYDPEQNKNFNRSTELLNILKDKNKS
jgi:hypothetical protein